MIAYLKGTLLTKSPQHIILDINGVGYEILIPLSTFYSLPQENGEVSLNIYTHVREDTLSLFGFSTYLESAFIMLGHIVLGGIIGFTTIYVALQIFMWLTKDLDELKEIKENNIAVGILLGIIIVSIALLLEPGIVTVLDSLIPFPPVSMIDIG